MMKAADEFCEQSAPVWLVGSCKGLLSGNIDLIIEMMKV
ncbi:unnamed protein product [Strongylus vulgaris]|uniref:Uncharacterized protein n=1 Tax=Strongylus vulgaris TaxID=40348 RepID=A0A3P7JJI0_STRVU|nr:unnamed protein product [Strongylus vulgaris]